MTTQEIVNSNTLPQASAPQPPGLINPSRCITKEDEVYLREYNLAASVISWDSGTFGTSLQVTAADITNIAISGDTVWYQINLHSAIPLDIETFHAHRLQISAHQAELEMAEESHQQPDELAGDEEISSLQPTPLSLTEGEAGDEEISSLQSTPLSPTEFEIGRQHGQADAAERLHPIYTKPSCEYAIGYLEGYHGSSSQQPPAPSQPVEWSVDYDPKWQRQSCLCRFALHWAWLHP